MASLYMCCSARRTEYSTASERSDPDLPSDSVGMIHGLSALRWTCAGIHQDGTTSVHAFLSKIHYHTQIVRSGIQTDRLKTDSAHHIAGGIDTAACWRVVLLLKRPCRVLSPPFSAEISGHVERCISKKHD